MCKGEDPLAPPQAQVGRWHCPVLFFQIQEWRKTRLGTCLGREEAIPSFCPCLSEKAMAPHSSTLAWKIPWTKEPARLQSVGLQESDTTEQPHFHFSLLSAREGNSNPLQCSCVKNPRDGGAWWAAVHGVAESRTRLKWLSSSSPCLYTYKQLSSDWAHCLLLSARFRGRR